MKTLMLVALLSSPACDWTVSSKVDPMTDKRVCMITSPSARLGVGVRDGQVGFYSGSAYTYDYLTIRVDDLPAIRLSERSRNTGAYGPDARTVLAQIRSGQRIRVQFRDYPQSVNGDAPICELPKLIQDCL